MPDVEIEINPVSFITVGAIGPKGKRLFYLQAGDGARVVSLIIEKEQARALAEAIREMLDELGKRQAEALSSDAPDMSRMNMELREPLETQFRVERMGLGYDEEHDLVILVAQEVAPNAEEQDQEPEQERAFPGAPGTPSIARFWGTRKQMRALSQHAADVVKQGRADAAHNGRVLYYWT